MEPFEANQIEGLVLPKEAPLGTHIYFNDHNIASDGTGDAGSTSMCAEPTVGCSISSSSEAPAFPHLNPPKFSFYFFPVR